MAILYLYFMMRLLFPALCHPYRPFCQFAVSAESCFPSPIPLSVFHHVSHLFFTRGMIFIPQFFTPFSTENGSARLECWVIIPLWTFILKDTCYFILSRSESLSMRPLRFTVAVNYTFGLNTSKKLCLSNETLMSCVMSTLTDLIDILKCSWGPITG